MKVLKITADAYSRLVQENLRLWFENKKLKVALLKEEGKMKVKRWTTAPIAYDGFGTERTGEIKDICNDRKVEEVKIHEEHLYWQEMRYSSGNHLCLKADTVKDFIF